MAAEEELLLVTKTGWGPKGSLLYAVNRDIRLGIVQNREGPEGSERRDEGDNNNKDPVLVVGPGEDAVSIQVRVGDHTLLAILDTGARPSVIDRYTLQNLGLDKQMREDQSKVFGPL